MKWLWFREVERGRHLQLWPGQLPVAIITISSSPWPMWHLRIETKRYTSRGEVQCCSAKLFPDSVVSGPARMLRFTSRSTITSDTFKKVRQSQECYLDVFEGCPNLLSVLD